MSGTGLQGQRSWPERAPTDQTESICSIRKELILVKSVKGQECKTMIKKKKKEWYEVYKKEVVIQRERK